MGCISSKEAKAKKKRSTFDFIRCEEIQQQSEHFLRQIDFEHMNGVCDLNFWFFLTILHSNFQPRMIKF